jgi:D-beta-D-heptose 7-phosphate kinase/D-beta-D-heptose 1-phosphate adenosyltransferase
LKTFSSKIRSRRSLAQIAGAFRKRGERIVFTNGCFDLLHAGHVAYLEQAKRFGDVLIVGLNSDASVRRIKGPERPVNPEGDRLRIVAALQAVDYVTVFSEDTPLRLIQEIRPHVLVKGADWEKEKIVGGKEVESWGGKVKRVRLVPGRSTTKVLDKLRRG